MSKLGEVFVEILGDADPFADDFAAAIGDAGTLASDELTEAMGMAGDEVTAGLSEAGEAAGEGLADGVAGATEGLGDELGAAGAAAGDELASGLEAAVADVDLDVDVGGAFDGIGDAAEAAAGDVEDAMAGVGDAISSEIAAGVDDAEDSLGGLTDSLGSVQGALATVAGGAGMEAFARSQQDASLSVMRMSDRLGESEDAIRDMIDGVTDWTFSSADAAEGMEFLSQRGVDNMETMQELLPAWDNFADATGGEYVQSMDDASRALGAFGIPAEEAADHMDTLTFMVNEVDVPLDRLSRSLRGNEEELSDLGLGLDETAGLLGAMGANGLDGRDAVALLNTELGNAEGDLDSLLGALGLTTDQFEEYTGKVLDAEGITERQADQANSLATPMERLGGWVENVAFKFGDFGEMAGMVAAPLGALGPMMLAANQGAQLLQGGLGAKMVGALRGAATGFRTLATAILTNPLFWIAAVIIGIIAVIWHFRDEIMAGLGAAWDWIRDTAGAVWEWLSDTVGQAVDWIVDFVGGLRDRVVEFFQAMVQNIIDYHPLAIAYRLVVEYVPQIVEAIAGFVGDVIGWFIDLKDRVFDWVEGLWWDLRDATWEWRTGMVDTIRGFVDTVVDTIAGWVETIVGFVTDLWQRWVNLVHTIRDAVIDAVVGLVTTVVSTISGWVSDVIGFVQSLRDDFTGTISDLVDNVLTFFTELPGRILSALGDLSTLLLDVGKDIVQGLIDGVSGMATAAGGAIVDVGRNMLGSVKGFFGISSPSTVFAGFGEDLIDGLALGVEREASAGIQALEDFANQATAAAHITPLVDGADLGPVDVNARTAVHPRELATAGASARSGDDVTINVYTSNPVKAARQTVQELRDRAHLGGRMDPTVTDDQGVTHGR